MPRSKQLTDRLRDILAVLPRTRRRTSLARAPPLAAQRAKEIIERNAANMAHIYVQDVEALQTQPLDA